MTNPRNRRRIGLSESSKNTTRQHNTVCSSSTRRKSYIHRPRAFYPHRFAAAASAATFDEEVYPILGTPPRLLATMARKTKAGDGDPFDDLATNTDTLVRQIESLRRRNTKLARRIDAEKKKAANVEQMMLREERKKNIEMTACALDRYTFGS